MRKLFRLHDYSENMKDKITTPSLKDKVDRWWQDVKNVRGYKEEELIWDEFERLFRKKYLSQRYYDGKAKYFYELKMGSMTNEQYITKFMDLLRYVHYLKDEKEKIQRFINGFPVAFKDWIEFDEPRLLEEEIKNLKRCYEKSNHKTEFKHNWKGNENTKGKWSNNQGRPQDVGDKENVAPHKNFKVVERRHGF